MQISSEVTAFLDDIIAIRRQLHRHPELGFEEHDTHDLILRELAKLAPDRVETLAGTGVKAVWYAETPLATLGFRADMDALNTQEENDVEYASACPGKMHGCGHDGHTALLIMLARLVDRHKDQLRHNVVLLFQPAEEGRCGANRMIESGALDNPKIDLIYGMHLWPDVPKGKIGIRWGSQMSRSCEFDIIAHGRSAHGASPQKGVDAVVASAALIVMLQTAISRNVDPHQDALLTIGSISGGTARNVIADHVEMNATLRVFSSEVYDSLMARIHAMANGVATATGARFEIIEKVQYPSVVNPRPLVEDLYTYLDSMDDTVLVEPAMPSEDFACYQQQIPGLFIFLGIGGGKNRVPLHNSRFDFDEDALLTGLELYRRILGLGESR